MNKLFASLTVSVCLMVGCSNQPANNPAPGLAAATNATPAQIFTTARDTTLRLSQTEEAPFEAFGQPLETQVCVFVDPNRSFQTMVGIGGALTDASAEVFARLPDAAQKEFLTAYFDQKKGIGYNFARTKHRQL